MSKNYYIYFHKNPITNNIFYVGMGTGDRCKDFKRGRNPYYINYVKKYGNPIIEVPHKNLSKEEACVLEKDYIKKYGRKLYEENGTLLNISEGGESGVKGRKYNMSQSHKENIIRNVIGKKKHTLKSKDKIRKHRLGTKMEQSSKDKISKIHKGTKKSKETREKMSKSHTGRKITWGEKISKAKKGKPNPKLNIPIEKYTLDGKYITSFSSIKAASDGNKSLAESIRRCIHGEYKSAGGFIWKKIL